MDAQLQEVIETIKSEGRKTAEKQAEQIIASAEENARQIVEDAEGKARKIVDDAKAEQAKLDQSGRETLRQAGRDLILGVQTQLESIFRAVVGTAVGEAISSDILENTIVTVVSAWSQGKDQPVDVLLSEKDASRLEARLRNRLSEHIAAGTEIRPTNAVKSGFRVSTKDGTLYYDFTVASIAEALSAFVGPRLREILKDAAEADGSPGSSTTSK